MIFLFLLCLVQWVSGAPVTGFFQNLCDLTTIADQWESWCVGTDVCSWNGVSCLSVGKETYVSKLQLDTVDLGGVFPSPGNASAEFWGLSSLSMNRCNISGDIPLWIAEVPMSTLRLAGNRLTGTFPKELRGNFPSVFDVSSNRLQGECPGNDYPIGKYFDVSDNDFSGTLAPKSNYYCLYYNISHNRFTGMAPMFSGLTDGGYDISHNLLSGIGNCTLKNGDPCYPPTKAAILGGQCMAPAVSTPVVVNINPNPFSFPFTGTFAEVAASCFNDTEISATHLNFQRARIQQLAQNSLFKTPLL